MISVADRLHLEAAIELAGRGRYSTSPNPRVGCVLVREGGVIGRGWHVRAGEGHAEVNALADAGGDTRGATAYVSLEPCAFHGRTPPCTGQLVRAGVSRVVGAMTDPDDRVAGRGYAALRAAGLVVDTVELPAAQALNAGYVHRHVHGRPRVRVKIGASMDGATAMADGESRWITSAESRADVQRLRAESCAVITGVGTVLADDPVLTVRDERYAVGGRLRQPLRVVADSRLRTPANARLFESPGEVLFAHAEEAAARRFPGARVACGEGRVDLAVLLEVLAERSINDVLVEAGPTLVGAFVTTGLWDELIVYMAPVLLGGHTRRMAELEVHRLADRVPAELADVARVGPDLRVSLVRAGGPADTCESDPPDAVEAGGA